jgi:hypothetical protein
MVDVLLAPPLLANQKQLFLGEDMSPWQKRLIEERDELEVKLRRLYWVLTRQKDLHILEEERVLLSEQFRVMRDYYRILGDRICKMEVQSEIN